MSRDANRMQVRLMGELFTVKGNGAKEDIQRASEYLDERLNYLKLRCPQLTPKNLALLTAFNLADELLRVKRDYEALATILDKQ